MCYFEIEEVYLELLSVGIIVKEGSFKVYFDSILVGKGTFVVLVESKRQSGLDGVIFSRGLVGKFYLLMAFYFWTLDILYTKLLF